MSFLKFGSIKGAAYQHDFGQDIDRLYEREKYATEVRKERENKAAYYGSMLQEVEATTPYNTRRLESYYDDLTGELADFVVNNPNFETDINLQRQFQDIARRFQDNDIIREDAQVAKSLEDLKNEALTREMDGEDYDYEYGKYKEYAENGPGPDGSPYIFENFKKTYLTDVVTQLAEIARPGLEVTTVEIPSDEEGGIGRIETRTQVNAQKLDYIARMAFTRSDFDRTIDKAWQGAKESGLYPEGKLGFVKKLINAQLTYGSEFRAWNENDIMDRKTRATMQSEYGQNNPVFAQYILDHLYGEEGETASDSRNLIFSPWAKKGEWFNPSTYVPINGTEFSTLAKNTRKTDQNSVDYVNIPLDMSIMAEGAGKVFQDEHGVAMVEVNVVIPILSGEKKDLRDKLTGLGWSNDKFTTLGMIVQQMAPYEGAQQTADFFRGTIVVPATFDESQIHQYQREWSTDTEAMKNQSQYRALSGVAGRTKGNVEYQREVQARKEKPSETPYRANDLNVKYGLGDGRWADLPYIPGTDREMQRTVNGVHYIYNWSTGRTRSKKTE